VKKVTNKQVKTLFDDIVSDVVTMVNEHRKGKEPKVPKTKENLDHEDKIKIGLWFVKKMGGLESARRVINATELALVAMGD